MTTTVYGVEEHFGSHIYILSIPDTTNSETKKLKGSPEGTQLSTFDKNTLNSLTQDTEI